MASAKLCSNVWKHNTNNFLFLIRYFDLLLVCDWIIFKSSNIQQAGFSMKGKKKKKKEEEICQMIA